MPVINSSFRRLRCLVFSDRAIVIALGVPAVAHKTIELFLILGAAEFAQIRVEFLAHFVKLAALFLHPVEFGLTPVVKGDVAGRKMRAVTAMRAAAGGKEAIGRLVDVTLEAAQTVAEDDVGKHGKTQRPENHEAENHQGNGSRSPIRSKQC
ncbi:hypothetical protein CUJ84_Chr004778 [Rhizobium leguminosarum]|uniref:Uncharacterized protein n=1 Tax=Rhizobium leguminosarum TaxID=384 RepID=A0A2K9ZA61_RHILE|nr:hypothetical protein CUJ84_Chr004778 [Rhizobium leguminosarum]